MAARKGAETEATDAIRQLIPELGATTLLTADDLTPAQLELVKKAQTRMLLAKAAEMIDQLDKRARRTQFVRTKAAEAQAHVEHRQSKCMHMRRGVQGMETAINTMQINGVLIGVCAAFDRHGRICGKRFATPPQPGMGWEAFPPNLIPGREAIAVTATMLGEADAADAEQLQRMVQSIMGDGADAAAVEQMRGGAAIRAE